jgi:hypothetical protein
MEVKDTPAKGMVEVGAVVLQWFNLKDLMFTSHIIMVMVVVVTEIRAVVDMEIRAVVDMAIKEVDMEIRVAVVTEIKEVAVMRSRFRPEEVVMTIKGMGKNMLTSNPSFQQGVAMVEVNP